MSGRFVLKEGGGRDGVSCNRRVINKCRVTAADNLKPYSLLLPKLAQEDHKNIVTRDITNKECALNYSFSSVAITKTLLKLYTQKQSTLDI